MSNTLKQDSYLSRNRWLVILFFVMMIVVMQEMFKSMPELGFSIPNLIVYVAAALGLVYAGILNVLAGTVSAKLFRTFVLVIAVGLLLFYILKGL